MLADEWLFDVICKGCEIFTGKKGKKSPIANYHTQKNASLINSVSGKEEQAIIRDKPLKEFIPSVQQTLPGKIEEFKHLIQSFIEANGNQIFSKRIYWLNFPEKITINAKKALNIPENESILMIMDSTIMGSGKEGIALTDWGLRYNDGVDSWNLKWNDLQEKYSLSISKVDLGIMVDVLLLKAKPGNDLVVNKTINLSMASINYDILARILSKTCLIFIGKSIDL